MRLFSSTVTLICIATLPGVFACRTPEKVDTTTSGLTPEESVEDTDGDGLTGSDDCDEGNAAVNSAAAEVCNGIDDNCDGVIDEGVTSVFFTDADADGFGDPSTGAEACAAGESQVTNDQDCDDTNADVFPGAEELCNGLDDDCDTEIDEDGNSIWYDDLDGDGFGNPTTAFEDCAPNGAVANGDDCDDDDPAVNPDAEEICNEIDDDCDDDVDEGVTNTYYIDTDGDGWGAPESTTEACDEPLGYATEVGDCDDGNADVNPAATEVCNSIDDDCDGDIDDDDSSVDLSTGSTTYADIDRDTYGDPTASDTSCTAPSGYVTDNTDCDDANDAVNPAASEVCNSIDDDCDGDIDDDDRSVDLSTGTTTYADTDRDTYGDPTASDLSCTAPSGYVTDNTDCDDANAAVNPAATEVCNSIDDDCDGDVDDDDRSIDLSTGTTTYADTDRDTYGDPSASDLSCTAPSGYVTDNTDCDDANAAVNPAASEVCNSIDDDCDGDIDDDDSSVDLSTATTSYADSDSDSYGDAAVSSITCTVPSGYVADDTDCDDTDPTAYPGASEYRDGVDNDCDGTADDDLYKGTGADGSLSVSGTVDLTTDASGTRTDADGIAFVVTAIGSDTITVDTTVSGLAAGDEVLLINLQGSDTAHAAVGTWELFTVDSVSGADVTLLGTVTGTYGESSNTDLTDQTIVLQRVPNYTDVTVAAGGVLTASAWDGSSGGIVAFRASGTVSIASGGYIDADSLGYAAGETGTFGNCDAFQGESYAGLGDGDGDGVCTAYNEYYGHWANNYGGGGAHITGAGGEHAGGATDGDSWTGGSATPPYAGSTYGDATLATMFYGSGGGGVWNGGTDTPGENPGPGGDGGGIILIGADTLTATGAESITSFGGTTIHWASGTWTYGAGGGAGGTIWLQAETLSLGSGAVDASGGFGEATHIRHGGDGGEGRVRIDCVTCNGSAWGTASADAALDDMAEPDPGYTEQPE